MENETLKRIINKIKKYELASSFSDVEQFKNWVSKLNNTQINNFLSLDINLEEIKNLKRLLINLDLLNCIDYKQRVTAISLLKNGEGCWHLFDAICNPEFLKSKNFYKDIELLSKADTARYGLWVLGKEAFINSPYHDEDLKLLVETHDINQENPLDFVVSDAIATVAGNSDSIRSPYHRADMKLISTVGIDCLQMSNSYPKWGLNNLAINKVSLADEYHLENMEILAKNPIAIKFLYIIMTSQNFIKGKNYRKEVEALVNAKSKITARALYYYIVNPERKYMFDTEFLDDCAYSLDDAYIYDTNSVAGSSDPDYLKNLDRINNIDDKFVMHFVSLLMNPDFINSEYKDFDLELLQSITSKPIFMDLYHLMTNKSSLESKYHKTDAVMISQSNIDGVRDLLLEKAGNSYSLDSANHEYDMEYIFKLNLDSIPEEIYFEMYYYLFKENGIDDAAHKEKLEKLLQGILVERNTSVSSYLDTLQTQIENSKEESQIIESAININSKPKSKILGLIEKYIKK